MNTAFTSPTAFFFYFLIVGSVIVYFILLFDKKNRQKINKVLTQAKDVQPLFMIKAAQYKMMAVKDSFARDKISSPSVELELDKLTADYDKGLISLPDYCQQLNSLLKKTA
ncbi:hypothetical protein ACFQZX_04645 [Mucilaginibacter litoreus]|uniref:Uncharacterized protein n=1 Tax=Mucilaginibacter litoreus TaxID=1048221 RepID=A0ABW3API4_9SPHI